MNHSEKLLDEYLRRPINKMTSLVVSEVEVIPLKKCLGTAIESRVPFRTRKAHPSEINNSHFENLSGRKIGWLTVIGLAADFKQVWSCRCNCGTYVLRKSKSIKNENNQQDRCQVCRHKLFLKRDEFYRTTGKDRHINEFL